MKLGLKVGSWVLRRKVNARNPQKIKKKYFQETLYKEAGSLRKLLPRSYRLN